MALKHRRASALTLPALWFVSFCMRQRSGEGKYFSSHERSEGVGNLHFSDLHEAVLLEWIKSH